MTERRPNASEPPRLDDVEPDEVGPLGTESPANAGTEPREDSEPGLVGGGDQGAHPGSLGGVPEPKPPDDNADDAARRGDSASDDRPTEDPRPS
jgi:hypothetical protein